MRTVQSPGGLKGLKTPINSVPGSDRPCVPRSPEADRPPGSPGARRCRCRWRCRCPRRGCAARRRPCPCPCRWLRAVRMGMWGVSAKPGRGRVRGFHGGRYSWYSRGREGEGRARAHLGIPHVQRQQTALAVAGRWVHQAVLQAHHDLLRHVALQPPPRLAIVLYRRKGGRKRAR